MRNVNILFLKKIVILFIILIFWVLSSSFTLFSSDMIREVNCYNVLSTKKIRSHDVTDIVTNYVPLGLSYDETIKLFKQKGVKVRPSKKTPHLDPKHFTDQDYFGYYRFSSGFIYEYRLQVFMSFSKENKLDKIKATCYLESL